LPIVNNLIHNANKIDLTIQQVELFHTGISKILCQYHCWRTIHYNLNVSGHQMHEKTPPSCVGHRGQTPNWEPNLHRWVFYFVVPLCYTVVVLNLYRMLNSQAHH